ncbi:Males-absent on the first protein [Zalerion maritima]|uniref:histone acetyltransferase n=1 Tax=Zalerion maritima TaxID=339359 RepID=A0AAD5RUM1_9PEZI|nr:Males-absent on the first protein [Zalerion maritima]
MNPPKRAYDGPVTEKRPLRQPIPSGTDYTPVYGGDGSRRQNPDPDDSVPLSPPKPRRIQMKSATPAPAPTSTPVRVPSSSPTAQNLSQQPRPNTQNGQPNMTPTKPVFMGPRATPMRPPSVAVIRPTTNGNRPHHARLSQTPTNKTGHPYATSAPPAPPSTAKPKHERNIEKVMLGSLCFDTWYTSYYSKDVLGDNHPGGGKGGKAVSSNSNHNNNYASPAGSASANDSSDPRPEHNHVHSHGKGGVTTKEDDGAKVPGRANNAIPVLERLYVCPCCFKYSKELVTWWAHVRYCQSKRHVPGEKIYVHPKGVSRMPPSRGHSTPSVSSRRGSFVKRAAAAAAEEAREVHNEGEYSIWEVDGEKDTLFCQNLSLFAKLFLETKSVFYDVTGFKYYLLVYSAPEGSQTNIKDRILGFFSKEKVSWDNNNLACILVFPPWQKKGFGSLLMGVSYEISRREGVIGGPEKPISELGRKGYRRYWGGEITRWMETLEPDEQTGEMIFDVDDCSKATWIAPEDCLAILRDMGVVYHGMGPPKPKKPTPPEGQDGDKENDEPNVIQDVVEEEEEYEDMRRVKMDRSQVRRWIAQNRISLERPCDPNGFMSGYIQFSVEMEID